MAAAYQDKAHPMNSADYHTGKSCVERGCTNASGTGWSPIWCFDHNVERMDRISAAFDTELARHTPPAG